MYKYILESAGNINWMALFALLTFVAVFLGSAIMAFLKDKKTLSHMAHLPLDEDYDRYDHNTKQD